jgi:hypothetical protein
MTANNNHKLIQSLIKDDLINSKLVAGLNDLGLDAGAYFLHLTETIFELLEIPAGKDSDQIFEYYLEEMKRVKAIDLSKSYGELEELTAEIFEQLVEMKGQLHSGQ